jgi:hypothetical protein
MKTLGYKLSKKRKGIPKMGFEQESKRKTLRRWPRSRWEQQDRRDVKEEPRTWQEIEEKTEVWEERDR